MEFLSNRCMSMTYARLAPLATAPWLGRQGRAGLRCGGRHGLLLSLWRGTPARALYPSSLTPQPGGAPPAAGITVAAASPGAAADHAAASAITADERFMRLALEQAQLAFDADEVPVGAVLVSAGGEVLAAAHNQMEASSDPTAHAELLCIRQAVTALGGWRLLASTLYVTLEPCPMCAGALLQSRVGSLVYGARNSLLGADGSWIAMLPRSSCCGCGDGASSSNNNRNQSSCSSSCSSKNSSQSSRPSGECATAEGQQAAPPLPAASVAVVQPTKPHPFHPNMSVRRGVLAAECSDLMRSFFLRRRKQAAATADAAKPQALELMPLASCTQTSVLLPL